MRLKGKRKLMMLALVLILFAVSSFSMIPDSFYKIPNAAIDYLKNNAPNTLRHIIRIQNEQKALEELNTADMFDIGLDGIDIKLFSPSILPAGDTLVCRAVLSADPGIEANLIWYINDEIVSEELVFTDNITDLEHKIEYSRDMNQKANIKVSLQYITNQGELHEISDENPITFANYKKSHWMDIEAPRVLGIVSSTYAGDRTLEWALENDYDDFDKEVFVHAKGYESETNFLIWVNRAHQRANIFVKTGEDWVLIESFLVATGSPGAVTPRGETYITTRSEAGWHFGTHIVRPVVRFYPNSPYAFHSRLLHPRTKEVIDDRMGFPASAGCVRLICEDIQYIYDNIPNRTTVIIY